MENVPNATSEEELIKLRDEGRISEDDYAELRQMLQKSAGTELESAAEQTNQTKSKRKLGRVAFSLMLLGIVLPGACFLLLEALVATGPSVHLNVAPWFFLGLALEIGAFVLGVIA